VEYLELLSRTNTSRLDSLKLLPCSTALNGMIKVIPLLYFTSNVRGGAAICEIVSNCQVDQIICTDFGFFDRLGRGMPPSSDSADRWIPLKAFRIFAVFPIS